MGLFSQVFIIASHVPDLLFSFLLPHFLSSIHVQAGSVSANSVVAIPSAFCATQYHIGCHFLGCLTSPGLTTLFFHPKTSSSRLGAQQTTNVPGTDPWLWILALVCLARVSLLLSLHCKLWGPGPHSPLAAQHRLSDSPAEDCHKECHKQPGIQTRHWKEKHPILASEPSLVALRDCLV